MTLGLKSGQMKVEFFRAIFIKSGKGLSIRLIGRFPRLLRVLLLTVVLQLLWVTESPLPQILFIYVTIPIARVIKRNTFH